MDIQEFKNKLLKEKEDLELLLKSFEIDEETVKEMGGETEVSDIADQYKEKERIYNQKEVVLKRLKKINEALERIESGKYGKCKYCGNDIEETRLKIDPATETCRNCSLKQV